MTTRSDKGVNEAAIGENGRINYRGGDTVRPPMRTVEHLSEDEVPIAGVDCAAMGLIVPCSGCGGDLAVVCRTCDL